MTTTTRCRACGLTIVIGPDGPTTDVLARNDEFFHTSCVEVHTPDYELETPAYHIPKDW